MEGGTEIPKEHIEIFITEAEEQIAVWEERVLALERDPDNTELLKELFRAVHTIKGSAGFVGCDELRMLTHELETTIQDVRDGAQELDSERMGILFDGLDATKLCIGGMKEDRKVDIDYDSVIEKIRKCNTLSESDLPMGTPIAAGESDALDTVPERGSVNARTYQLEIDITADENEAFLRGLLIQSKLEDIGEILRIDPPLEDLRLKEGGFRFQITVETDQTAETLRKAADIDQVTILSLADLTAEEENPDEKEAGGRSRGSRVIAERPKKMEEVVRVHVNKLDSMMNLVGELVVANSRFISILNEGRARHGDLDVLVELKDKTESLSHIARNLQDTVMRISMLPAASIFSRFHRVVRDLAKVSNKDVDLEVFGEKTEIDKRILDGISEPLIHLLRNAVDHGIENREDRLSFGKDGTGTIRIGAYQEGDHICVVLSDDGIGIDRQAVIRKAISRGILESRNADNLTEKELFDLLFTPGFSTAEQVTDISGRGIGLDIVKKTVEEMGGSVRIESTLGLGTTTTITLPLTTVIIDSLVVSVMGSVYAFPMSSVLEMIRPFRSELRKVQQGTVICLREEVVAILDLAEVLWNENRLPEIWSDDVQVTVVILDYNGKKVGLIVDNLLGKQEIVVKSLSKNYIDTEGLIGVTIMGTGKVALIMDIKGTLDAYYREREGKPVLTNRMVRDGRERGEEPYAAVTERTAEADLPAAESSSDDRLYRLNARESEKMEEVLIDGAINASESMTELLGHEVRVSFPDFRAIPLDGITESFGGDEAPVAGIFVEFGGDITGVWAIVVAMDDLQKISDYLMGQPQGSTKEISETEISALKEMGNILTASFIRSIVEATDLDVHLMVPEISIDMCLAVMDSILVRFNQPGREILVTEAELFSMETQNEICHLFILMENESTARLIQVLTREAKGLFEKAGLWRRRFLSEDDDAEIGGDESEQPGELQRF